MTNSYHFSEKHGKEFLEYAEWFNSEDQKDAINEANQIALQEYPNENELVRFALVQNLMYQKYLEIKRSKYS